MLHLILNDALCFWQSAEGELGKNEPECSYKFTISILLFDSYGSDPFIRKSLMYSTRFQFSFKYGTEESRVNLDLRFLEF